MLKIDEPLELSAPLAWQLAPRLCHKDAETGQSCAWNHRLWQCLRVMGLGGSPEINAEFYRHAFTAVKGAAGPPRILISGAADYSMLAHALAAFKERDIEPDVTVVDICETPLALNRWYAERISCRIATHCCDIAEFRAADGFDAICTHSFFGQIPAGRRPQLLTAWCRLLRPGGLAISVDRVRAVCSGAPIGFSPSQAQLFCSTVRGQAQNIAAALAIEPRELVQAAEIYAATQALHPVRSHEEMRNLFEYAGFGIEQLIGGPNEAGTVQEDSGPAIPAKADYVRIIANRK